MDPSDFHPRLLDERLTDLWQGGVRFATRLAIALGLATVTAILLGAAVTDHGFVQLVVTLFAAMGLWLPFAVIVGRIDRARQRRRAQRAEREHIAVPATAHEGTGWARLAAIAPGQAERIAAIRRSIERSRVQLGQAELDADAHDLCILIDRRLPELIDRELDTLPPDDRDRRRRVEDLVALVEQFARHCGRRNATVPGDSDFEAAVLRRRFEARLSDF